MTKIAAKDAVILISGSKFSTYVTAYETEYSIEPIEATGFGDGAKNYIPGMATAKIGCDCLWDNTVSVGVNAKLQTSGQTGVITILPETGNLGAASLTLPYLQANYTPGAAVSDIMKIGNIEFTSYGNNNALELGVVLYSGVITNTTTSSTFDNTLATTGAYAATLHIWTKAATDTYSIALQHSTNGSAWTTANTFAINGSAIAAERLTGTALNQYRRIVATRTGSAGNALGLTISLYSI